MKTPIKSGGEAMPADKNADAFHTSTPILGFARRLCEAAAAYNKAERLEFAANKNNDVVTSGGVSFSVAGDAAAKHFYDEELMARAAISMHKAESLEDAAIQIAHACIHFDMLWDQFPSEAETFHVLQDYRATLRLLYSVLDFIDGIAPQKLAETLGTEYANPHMSPWRCMEEVSRQELPA